MDDPAPVGASGRVGALRARIGERVRQVNQTTERESLAAGAALAELVVIGRAHLERLHGLLDRKLGSDGAELSHAVRGQGERIHAGLGWAMTALDQHCTAVAGAAGQAGQIADAAGRITRLASEARTLASDAREAARASAHGGGHAALAGQVKRMADAIAAANTRVVLLASTLAASLPMLHQQSATLGVAIGALAQELRTGSLGLHGQVQALRADVAGALEDSDRTVGEMVAATQAALSHLQFQDVCAQQLLETDTWLHDAHAALASPGEPVPAPVHVTAGSVAGDPHQAPGDVALF